MMKNVIKVIFMVVLCIASACSTMKSTTNSGKQADDKIYFEASGTEPFWGLTISEKEIRLNTMEDTLIAPHQLPIKAMDSNVKMYKIQSAAIEMTIQIAQLECTNEMSGQKSPYTLNIEYKRKSALETKKINGCGTYITDFNLHGSWELETLSGKKVDKTLFLDKVPQIEINTETNSFSGFAGCNSISGELFYEKDTVRFLKTIATMMYCGNDNKEREFLKALNSATTYLIDNNRLVLSNASNELLSFRKI
ncbi:META domain-containing protein [Flavobacterium sp.]